MLDPALYDLEYHRLYPEAPTHAPTIFPTTKYHYRMSQASREGFFDNVEGMTVIGDVGDDENETAVWVYHINVLKGSVEFVAVLFTILTVLLSFNQIGLHLTYNEHIGFRTYTVRILLMVPAYSITSYFGLHNPSNALIWAMIRDCYECVVLFSFMQYCLTYLGGPENLARYLMDKQLSEDVVPKTVDSAYKRQRSSRASFEDDSDVSDSDTSQWMFQRMMSHKSKKKKKMPTHAKHPSLCWLFCPCAPIWRPMQGEFTRPWKLGAEFVRLSLLGTLQYIPFSLLVTLAGIVGKSYGVYHDGRFTFDDVYLYAIIVRNWSQCWALYCLGLFYVTLHDELEDISPVLKFSVIKLVVLFMWWQGVFVNLLEQSNTMKSADDGLLERGWTTKEVGFCIQNFLCIIEMFFIAIGMHYAFHYSEWASDEVAEVHKGTSPWKALFQGKVVNTVKHALHDANSVKNSVKDTVKKLPATVRYAVSREERMKARKAKQSISRVKSDDSLDSNQSTDAKYLLPSRLLTRKERNVATKLFTEGVNFSDIFKSLKEINTLEKSLADDKANEMEEQRLVPESFDEYREEDNEEEDDDDVFADAEGGDDDDDDRTVFEDADSVVGDIEEGPRRPPSPSMADIREMASEVERSMSRSRAKDDATHSEQRARGEEDESERMLTVQPLSGDPLLVQSAKHDTIADIKGKVSKSIGFPVEKISLLVDNKPLNDATVASLVVPVNAVIQLTLLGGPKKK